MSSYQLYLNIEGIKYKVKKPTSPTPTGYTLTYTNNEADSYIVVLYADGSSATLSNDGTYDNVVQITTIIAEDLTAINGSTSYTIPYILTGDTTIVTEASCLTGDTLITLSNGTQKRIDELTLNDKVLSVNSITLELVEDEIIYCDSACNKTHNEHDIWKFEDGYEVKTVHRHRLYNCESEGFVNMDEWAIGDHTRTIDGKEIALLEHIHVNELVKHYTIFTKNYNNYFANNMLTGNKYSKEITFIDEDKNRN